MTHECWNDIREVVYEFEKDNLQCNYWERDHAAIIKWFKTKFVGINRRPNIFPVDDEWLVARDKVIKSPPTGQDAVTSLAMHAAGYVRLAPVVNRGKYIGEVGIHMRPDWFIRERFNEVVLRDFETDAELVSFDSTVDKILVTTHSPLEGMRKVEA